MPLLSRCLETETIRFTFRQKNHTRFFQNNTTYLMANTAPTSLTYALALGSLILGTVGQLSGPGFGGYGEAFYGRVGPYDANSTAFLEAMKESNSTAVFKIPGYDVSKPFPGQPIDGWTLRVVALDLSNPKYGQEIIDGNSRVMVGDALVIKAPDSLLETQPDDTRTVDAHPSWGMCIWDFGQPVEEKEKWNNPENKPLNEDGSCRGFLSDACVAALEREASKGPVYQIRSSTAGAASRYGSVVSCRSLRAPDECGENGPGNAGRASVPSYPGVPVPYLNGSVTQSDGWEFASTTAMVKANSTEDLRLFWDSMVLNYRTIVTAMINATIDPGRPSDEEGQSMARVHCVAPNGMGTGKSFAFNGTVPPAGAKVSSSGTGKLLGWATVPWVVSALVLLWVAMVA